MQDISHLMSEQLRKQYQAGSGPEPQVNAAEELGATSESAVESVAQAASGECALMGAQDEELDCAALEIPAPPSEPLGLTCPDLVV